MAGGLSPSVAAPAPPREALALRLLSMAVWAGSVGCVGCDAMRGTSNAGIRDVIKATVVLFRRSAGLAMENGARGGRCYGGEWDVRRDFVLVLSRCPNRGIAVLRAQLSRLLGVFCAGVAGGRWVSLLCCARVARLPQMPGGRCVRVQVQVPVEC